MSCSVSTPHRVSYNYNYIQELDCNSKDDIHLFLLMVIQWRVTGRSKAFKSVIVIETADVATVMNQEEGVELKEGRKHYVPLLDATTGTGMRV